MKRFYFELSKLWLVNFKKNLSPPLPSTPPSLLLLLCPPYMWKQFWFTKWIKSAVKQITLHLLFTKKIKKFKKSSVQWMNHFKMYWFLKNSLLHTSIIDLGPAVRNLLSKTFFEMKHTHTKEKKISFKKIIKNKIIGLV